MKISGRRLCFWACPAILQSPRHLLCICICVCICMCICICIFICISVVGHGQWSRNYLGTSSGQENIPSCTSLTTNEWTKPIISQMSFGRNGHRARYLWDECIRAPNSGETVNVFSFLSDSGASLSSLTLAFGQSCHGLVPLIWMSLYQCPFRQNILV